MKMRREAPELKRCCFCLPLRRGLITWGYIKLALDLVTWSLLVYFLTLIRAIHVLLIVELVFLVVDAVFNIVLIVGGHLKRVKLLKAAYIYSLVWLGLLLLVACWHIYMEVRLALNFMSYDMSLESILSITLPGLALTFVNILLQIYLILLIRTEVVKLQDQSLEIQFSNAASAEAHCTLHVSAATQ